MILFKQKQISAIANRNDRKRSGKDEKALKKVQALEKIKKQTGTTAKQYTE